MSFLSGLPSYSWYIVPAFLTLITIVVFVHELGHFLIARLFGVRVDIFSIGFGRGLLTWKDRHQTQWKIGWIPLGGYVKFFGDADGASTPDREAAAGMSAQDRKVAFLFKPLWQRALVVIGGPLANFLLAIVILSALFMFHGQIVVPPVVGDIVPHGPAAKAGFQIGDRILSVDGTQTGSFVDVAQVVSLSAGQTLPIVLDRAGRQLTVWAVPQEVALTDRLGNRQKVGDLGLSPPAPPIVDSVLPGKPAQRAGLRPGDRIVSIDGRAVTSFEQVQRLISANPGRQVEIVLGRGRGTVTTHATPYRDKDGRRLLGFAFAVPVSLERLPPFAAFEASITEIRQIVATTFRALFHSSTGLHQVSGIIGIAKVSGQAASEGMITLVNLIALLSVSIGVVNLFPIPLLDGGHLLYYACEAVLGRPLGERAQDVGFRVGLAVVAGIFILATWNDLLNLF